MSSRLQEVARKFYLRSDRVLNTFNETLHEEVKDCCRNSHSPTRQQCVLNLYDAWTEFSKDLLIASARGGYMTSGGVSLGPATNLAGADPLNFIYALSRSFSASKPPSWGMSNEFIRMARSLGVGNYATVSGAIGSMDSPVESIRMTRNYIAHRNSLTAGKAIRSLSGYGATSPLDVDRVLLMATEHGVPVFEDWRNKLVLIALSACR